MFSVLGAMTLPFSSLIPSAKTFLPSAHEAESWEMAPFVPPTLLRVSSFAPTSGCEICGAFFGSP